jgi:hypothetical protein
MTRQAANPHSQKGHIERMLDAVAVVDDAFLFARTLLRLFCLERV